jgi:hypothetical protein
VIQDASVLVVEVPSTALECVDGLVVDETEAGRLLGGSAPDTVSQALDAASGIAAASRTGHVVGAARSYPDFARKGTPRQ